MTSPRRTADPDVSVSPYKLASVLLQYPSTTLFDGIDQLDVVARQVPARRGRAAFARFLGWLRVTSPIEVAQSYVEAFDLNRRGGLYLTYYRYGDTRRRGMSLLAFKTTYRAAGFIPTDHELPDYLPMVLEFAAISSQGESVLRAHRADLELIRRSLEQAGSPYAEILDAVCSHLPRPGRRDLSLIRRVQEQGPPTEEVGIDAFAPPDYLRPLPGAERTPR